MISRRSSSRVALSVAGALLFAGGAGFAMSACSSTTTEAGPAAEAGTDAKPDSRVKVEAGPEEDSGTPPQTEEQCIAACNAAHPASVAKETAIDTCWAASCQGPCVDDPPTAFDAGVADGGDAGDGGVDASDLCGTGVNSATVDCDNCTQANCCPSWKGCFDDTDCTALDDCIGKCLP